MHGAAPHAFQYGFWRRYSPGTMTSLREVRQKVRTPSPTPARAGMAPKAKRAAPEAPLSGQVDGYDYKLFRGTNGNVLRYRAAGTTWNKSALCKLKKDEGPDDIPDIIRAATSKATAATEASAPAALDAHADGEAAVAPASPDAKRPRLPVDRFSPDLSAYDRARLGQRHHRVRLDSYCDLQDEVKRLRAFYADVVEALSRGSLGNDAPVVVSVLQAALAEYLTAAEEADDDDAADAAEVTASAAAVMGTAVPTPGTPAAEPPSEAPAEPPAAEPPAAPRETARVKAGRELRDTLREAIRHESANRPTAAKAVMAEARASGTRPASDALAKKRAGELRECLFTVGNLDLTEKVLAKFLAMPEVKRPLPEHLRESQKEHVDSSTAKVLLQAARDFFKVHHRGTGVVCRPQRPCRVARERRALRWTDLRGGLACRQGPLVPVRGASGHWRGSVLRPA